MGREQQKAESMWVENNFNKEKPEEIGARGNISSVTGNLGSSNMGSNFSRRADELSHTRLRCEGAAAKARDV